MLGHAIAAHANTLHPHPTPATPAMWALHARAMKTMGFDDLVLVAPRWANVLRREETIQRASGALDVLEKGAHRGHAGRGAGRHDHLCATAMTPRDFGPPATKTSTAATCA
jgi:tRNA/rRNA methyltransferase